jgi:hypothetical protein
MPMMSAVEAAFQARTDLRIFGSNARLLFALALRYQIDDLSTVANDALTDDSDDKKCDLLYVDSEAGFAVIAQGNEAQDSNRQAAPSNKASDLNTAATWLLNRELAELPEVLQPGARQLRDALGDRKLQRLDFWYVHNLPESSNVKEELKSVELTATTALKAHYSEAEIEVSAHEIGNRTLDDWYRALSAPILVNEAFEVAVPGGYETNGSAWRAFATAVPADWLHSVFHNHKTDLFSANLRGYLGSRQSDSNINYAIKTSVAKDPLDFWVYNNGLTALVHEYSVMSEPNSTIKLKIRGLSVVNGAQTTGAIGSGAVPGPQALVPARFVKCEDLATITNIIRYNNSQNKLEAADFRSNDRVQARLRDEFTHIPEAKYLGGRRGGADDVIKRLSNLLPADTCAQALATFHQDPVNAYHRKSELWSSDLLYSKYFFDETRATHIVFTYSLLKCVEAVRVKLRETAPGDLTESLQEQLAFLRLRGSAFLLVAAIAACLETFAGKALPNKFRVSFGAVSPEQAQGYWDPIVSATFPFHSQLAPAVTGGLKNLEEASKAIANFRSMVEATKTPNAAVFHQFAALLSY